MTEKRGRGDLLLKLLGGALAVVGALSVVIGVLGLDPDSKQSDDSDPLGPRPSAVERIVPFVAAALCFGGAFWLVRATERDDAKR
jgi:hypothetical protein